MRLGLRKAVRVAAAARLEPMLRAKGVPAHLAPVFADKLAAKGGRFSTVPPSTTATP
ncbi:MAG: hypothetical protein IKQ55_06870 [Kiritimatiellae bacterium]|nr:hypothetical protein [Kiritimatiellia bacterium]